MAQQQRRLAVGIDGPAGAGKSTIAKLVARKHELEYLDTGAMYRSVALLSHRNSVDTADEDALESLAKTAQFRFEMDDSFTNHIILNDEDVSKVIREPHIGTLASKVAQKPRVRSQLVAKQRDMAAKGGVVMEGRDICTVVLPDADVKIFLTASAEERARRRCKQLEEQGKAENYGDVLKEIKERDERDTTREASPLKPAEDSVEVCTDNMTIEQVADEISRIMTSK
eukprot:CAMPEP_0119128948 /NCGR_PEP_ID=MMETSP1310-20130426/6900_1 /TAXON_ID=464262 /ORGANISM="Genus nov. species nov., Strain RCC2339" /LENGTH=226 /DNA_ID=CAMNT_0007119339 /DNA_START=151 /DNA_END=831 /DNA_ORIENTATION=-